MTLETEIAGIRMKNPLVLASGVMGLSKETLKTVAQAGAGAVTTKSISIEPRTGHHNPTVIGFEAGLMNAVGYSNPGIAESVKEFADMSDVPVPVIGSAVAGDAPAFAKTVRMLDELNFAGFELPLSCPHTPGFGLLAGQGTPEATEEITKAVKDITDRPVFVKLSPNISALGDVAKAAERAGANGITAVNTMGPGMVIDINTGKPVLDFRFGGVSGPALRPIAVRCVYDIYEAVKKPIIGLGGVTNGRDAIEMIQAGATAVGVGSAIYYRGISVFREICAEMTAWMDRMGYKNLKEIRGMAHE